MHARDKRKKRQVLMFYRPRKKIKKTDRPAEGGANLPPAPRSYTSEL